MVERISIGAMGVEAEIAPACGGLTVSATQAGRPLLFTPAEAKLIPGTIHYFGNWPLAPFANRAFDAILRFDNETFALPANDPESPGSTLHGFSWEASWDVVARELDRVKLRHRQSEPRGPYLYTAEQIVRAAAVGLITELTVVNDGQRRLPFGLGLHPWFPRDPDTEVAVAAERVFTLGDNYWPVSIAAVAGEADYGKPRRLPADREVAWQYVGSDGMAQIRYPARGYRIAMSWENGNCPLMWSPAGAPFLCIEPQTHAMGAPSEAIAQEAGPMTVLESGQSLRLALTIRAESL